MQAHAPEHCASMAEEMEITADFKPGEKARNDSKGDRKPWGDKIHMIESSSEGSENHRDNYI
jgi:hypothetical protein